MDKEKKYWVGVVISVFAIVLSIGSLYVSYWVYQDSQRENLLINFEPYQSNEHVILREKRQEFYPFDVFLDCIFINIGNRPLNIISHKVYNVVDGENIWHDKPEDYLWYAYLFFDEQGRRAYLPFSVDVGNSLRKSLRVTLDIDKNVHQILSNKFDYNISYEYTEILRELMEHDLDIFGNNVNYFVTGQDSSFYEIGWFYVNSKIENLNKQKLLIEFESGSGNFYQGDFDRF